jgi:hypothetical protein
MAQVIQTVGYTGSRQTLIWPANWQNQITAYLWGGGGGGGGGDVISGGNGTGGGYASVTFPVQQGDVIEISVGGAGGGGAGGTKGGAGSAGASLVQEVFSSRNPPPGQPPVYPTSNGAWGSFLNTYGVWDADIYSASFSRNYTVRFPYSGYYEFVGSCDNLGDFYLDGSRVLQAPGYGTSYSAVAYATAGNHSVSLVGRNYDGPAGIGLLIRGSFSGGRGGNAGFGGFSGAGGGSGGATVLRVNGAIIAAAGGGGGGGGAGRFGGNGTAPGTTAINVYGAGQDGGDQPGDGGGGGGGGGGWDAGGQSGYWGGGSASNPSGFGDVTGQGGNFGSSRVFGSGNTYADPSGQNPGGSATAYYPGLVARGGSGSTGSGTAGTDGYAAFIFNSAGVYVNNSGSFTPAKTVWIKHNNIWQAVQNIWVNDGGVWKNTLNNNTPTFAAAAGNFGVASVAGPQYEAPVMGVMGSMADIF